MNISNTQIANFWNQYDRFLKNIPITEIPHDLSYNLSKLCQSNLSQAFAVFKTIELDALKKLEAYHSQVQQLKLDIQKVLKNNHKIFLLGCGASGRLAMLLKRLWETDHPQQNNLVCVAAAGDISLIKSVEQFEDKEDFGIKQLLFQGYTPNDLVIGLSASGESPFILAAVKYAAETSIYKPYLVCNNPVSIIMDRNPKLGLFQTSFKSSIATMGKPQRESTEIKNSIKILALEIGPMALTGSTRLQATTAMQIALGSALLDKNFSLTLKNCQHTIENIDLEQLANITLAESDVLQKNEYVLYTTANLILGLSLLADTTERSPTFNITPFEDSNGKSSNFSPFYLNLTNTNNAKECWNRLFGSQPTCLNWPEFPETSDEYINGFDLSDSSPRKKAKYLPKKQHPQTWNINKNYLSVKFLDNNFETTLSNDLFEQTIIFKFLLNSHSTIMMGRLGYFQGNLMISLKPSNNKLIDRAIRYIIFILKSSYQIDIEYKAVADILFKELPNLQDNESIVLKVVTLIHKS